MPVTVRNADILFNDGTTQSSAAGAPTTTQVLNATAGAAAGAVGTYSWLTRTGVETTTFSTGSTYAGSTLRFNGIQRGGVNVTGVGTPAGTWRMMSYGLMQNTGYTESAGGLFLRIS
jgi:hypothetical protein